MAKPTHDTRATPPTTKPASSRDVVQTHLSASKQAAKEILSSKAKATQFLVSAGILDKEGKRLAKPYR